MQKHEFVQGKVRPTCCFQDDEGEYCNKRKKHIIHKLPKPRFYQEGEVVGDRYIVQKNGSFKKIGGRS